MDIIISLPALLKHELLGNQSASQISPNIFRAPLWQKALSHFRGMAEACAGLVSSGTYAWITPRAPPEVTPCHRSSPCWEMRSRYLLFKVSMWNLLQKTSEMQKRLAAAPGQALGCNSQLPPAPCADHSPEEGQSRDGRFGGHCVMSLTAGYWIAPHTHPVSQKQGPRLGRGIQPS